MLFFMGQCLCSSAYLSAQLVSVKLRWYFNFHFLMDGQPAKKSLNFSYQSINDKLFVQNALTCNISDLLPSLQLHFFDMNYYMTYYYCKTTGNFPITKFLQTP